MNKEALFEKLEEEQKALAEKLGKLISAIKSEGFEEKIGETQMELLVDQANVMRLYLKILTMRMVDLKDKKRSPQEERKQEEKREENTASKENNAKKEEATNEKIDKEVAEVIEKLKNLIDIKTRELSENRRQFLFPTFTFPDASYFDYPYWSHFYTIYC